MPVNIDTVYQRVLAAANKEQRGYITPLEFNLMANQAQMEIFEQYFYDLDQFKRKDNAPVLQLKSDDSSFSEMIELIHNKLRPFTSVQIVTGGTVFPDNYRTGKVFVAGVEVELTKINTILDLLASNFHREGLRNNPMYVRQYGNRDIEVFNHSGLLQTGVTAEIITEPERVEWGYTVVGEKALFNANRSDNFELHRSEESELVTKILLLAGIILNKPGLTQIAVGQDISRIQQQKL